MVKAVIGFDLRLFAYVSSFFCFFSSSPCSYSDLNLAPRDRLKPRTHWPLHPRSKQLEECSQTLLETELNTTTTTTTTTTAILLLTLNTMEISCLGATHEFYNLHPKRKTVFEN